MSHAALLTSYIGGAHVYRKRNNFEVIGRENVPSGVGILFCPNHWDLTDSWGVGTSAYSFKDVLLDYDCIPWNAPDQTNFFGNPIYRFVFGLLKNVPVVRGERSREAIDGQIAKFVDVLEDSNLVLFFEGTRSRDGSIGPCKSGVQLVVQRAKPKVIPVRIITENAEHVLNIEDGFNWLKIRNGVKGQVIFGKAIDFTEEEWLNRKLIGKRIRDEVISLHP